MIIQNYRGVRPAEIITVIEGNGTKEAPFQTVRYVITFTSVGGVNRMETIGKIVDLTEEERNWFNK